MVGAAGTVLDEAAYRTREERGGRCWHCGQARQRVTVQPTLGACCRTTVARQSHGRSRGRMPAPYNPRSGGCLRLCKVCELLLEQEPACLLETMKMEKEREAQILCDLLFEQMAVRCRTDGSRLFEETEIRVSSFSILDWWRRHEVWASIFAGQHIIFLCGLS
jgi:hypothetical protein